MTPQQRAAGMDGGRFAQVLLDHGADIEARTARGYYTPLHLAARMNAASAVRVLADRGADLHAVLGPGLTPLHCAAAVDAVGADVHGRAGDGSTSLRVAAEKHAWLAGAALLARGANLGEADGHPADPLLETGSEPAH